MNEQQHQSDDCFIPNLFLSQLPQGANKERNTSVEAFLKSFQGWADILPLDECVA